MFKPAFISAISASSDKYANYGAHLRGMDPGGILPPTPAQLATNPNHINAANPHPPAAAAASAVAFKNREAAIISQIRKHVLPVGLQLDIDRVTEASFVNNYNDGCPVFPSFAPIPAQPAPQGTLAAGTPIYPPDHPLAGRPLSMVDLYKYQQCGNSVARHIWQLVCDYGTKKQTALFNEMQNNNWANLKLSDVGISARTIHDAAALIDKMSVERGLGYEKTDSEKLHKRLMISDTPPTLKQIATQELTYASPQCRNIVTQLPDWRLSIIWLNELWVNHYEQGDMKYTAPRVTGQPRSNRVDGLSLSCNPCSRPVEADCDSDDGEAIYIAQAAASNPLVKEPWCWNCLGWGHTKNENGVFVCPSPRRFRSLADARALIDARIARQGATSNTKTNTNTRRPATGSRRPTGQRTRGSQRQPPKPSRDDKHDANAMQFGEDSDSRDDEDYTSEDELAAVFFLKVFVSFYPSNRDYDLATTTRNRP